jgi:hypothetical protein
MTKALMYLLPNFVNNKVPVMRFAIPGSKSSMVPSLKIANDTHIIPVIEKKIPRLMVNLLEFIFKVIYP